MTKAKLEKMLKEIEERVRWDAEFYQEKYNEISPKDVSSDMYWGLMTESNHILEIIKELKAES